MKAEPQPSFPFHRWCSSLQSPFYWQEPQLAASFLGTFWVARREHSTPHRMELYKAYSAFQTHIYNLTLHFFLDVISVPLNMSSLCVPSPHASHFPGVGARPSGGGPGGGVEALRGGDDRVSPSPAVRVGWGCFGWCSLCCASPVGEVAECGVSR